MALIKGLLFVGDVHAASARVGRRIDDYGQTCLGKLRQVAEIANKRQARALFLGDLFHRPGENNLAYLAAVRDILASFDFTPVLLNGSHDRVETRMSDRDAVAFLAACEVLQVCDTPKWVFQQEIEGAPVQVWGLPAGNPLPDALPAGVPGSTTFMMTHGDFDFRGPYPGAETLRPVVNCDVLINGHMHTPTPEVVHGATVCYNPGSITRPAISQLNHQPAVHFWAPALGISLERIPLKCEEGAAVFDLTGVRERADAAALKEALPKPLRVAQFAALLEGATSLAAGRTEDGSALAEELAEYFAENNTSPNLRAYLTQLIQQVVADAAKA